MQISKLISTFAFAALASGAAHGEDWGYRATLYGWFPGISASVDTRLGTLESNSSSSDALSSLDMAFMGTFSANRGKWSIVGDVLYVDLGTNQEGPFGTGIAGTSFNTNETAVSGYVLYRLTEDPKVVFDAGVGFRSFSVEADMKVTVGSLPSESVTASADWVDPLIAMRVAVPLDDKWFLNGFADWGGTGSDNQTWQVYGGVGYNFNEKWSTQVGYRYMALEHDLDGRPAEIDLSGFLIGASYAF